MPSVSAEQISLLKKELKSVKIERKQSELQLQRSVEAGKQLSGQVAKLKEQEAL